jgi:hypothetical protein
MKKILVFLCAVSSIFFVTNVSTALYIDFASSDFSGANGNSSFNTTVNGIGVSLWSQHPSWPGWGSASDAITWNPGPIGGVDGLGVSCDDEISNSGEKIDSEYIAIGFDQKLYVDHVDISDLFYENGYFERGSYWIIYSASSWSNQLFFQQNDSSKTPYPSSNGEFVLNVGDEVVGFRFAGIDHSPQHDYSIRGIQASAIPIPTSMLLIGVGLVGIVGIRRKLTK